MVGGVPTFESGALEFHFNKCHCVYRQMTINLILSYHILYHLISSHIILPYLSFLSLISSSCVTSPHLNLPYLIICRLCGTREDGAAAIGCFRTEAKIS